MHEWDHPPIFWGFNSPFPPPGANGHHRGGGTSADIVPTQIIFGSVAEISLKNRQNAKNPPLTPIVTKI